VGKKEQRKDYCTYGISLADHNRQMSRLKSSTFDTRLRDIWRKNLGLKGWLAIWNYPEQSIIIRLLRHRLLNQRLRVAHIPQAANQLIPKRAGEAVLRESVTIPTWLGGRS
jgi:hypothetical protein